MSLMMGQVRNYRTLLLVACLVFMALYNLFVYFFTAYPFNVPRNYMADPIPTRRDLVRKIMMIQREIEVKTEMSKDIDATWAKRLLNVAAELDPRVATGEEVDQSAVSQVAKDSGHTKRQAFRVCPEKYNGRQFDEDLKQNFMTVPCSSQRFQEVLTILLPAKGWETERIQVIIDNIRDHYDVNIVVLTYGYIEKKFGGKNVFVRRFSSDKKESEAVNEVMHTIKTPYVLVAHSFVHFDEESNLERLVRVLEDNPKVSVASGAYRDVDGVWHHGCLQTTSENYELEYLRGYEHSHSECMYCDDVLGPFVVRTEFLRSVYLTGAMEGSVMFRDWFLNVRLDSKLVMSCPDVMFYIKAEANMTKSDWYQVAQKWSVERIHSFDGKIYKFSCEEAQISCYNLMKTVSSFLVPPCCREIFRKELEYVQICAEEIGVHHELNAGSLLGAVKMDGMLPWDFDTDIKTDCADKDLWMSEGAKCLARKGCVLKSVIGNYWTSTCNASTVDLNCYHNLTKKLTPLYLETPTKVEFNEVLTRVPLNPARNSRNYFGKEYLKHAVHWRYSSSAIFPMDDGSGQTPGLWSSCIVPAFHSCIDHFPVDGNVKFHKPRCRGP